MFCRYSASITGILLIKFIYIRCVYSFPNRKPRRPLTSFKSDACIVDQRISGCFFFVGYFCVWQTGVCVAVLWCNCVNDSLFYSKKKPLLQPLQYQKFVCDKRRTCFSLSFLFTLLQLDFDFKQMLNLFSFSITFNCVICVNSDYS